MVLSAGTLVVYQIVTTLFASATYFVYMLCLIGVPLHRVRTLHCTCTLSPAAEMCSQVMTCLWMM